MAIATAMAVLFLVLVLLESAGYLTNPYLGLLVFVAVPTVFVGGLVLIPLGAWLAARRQRKGMTAPEWPVLDLRDGRQRGIAVAVLALTLVNLVIVSMGAYGGVHYMESAAFCGRVCHTTMEPQAVAHQAFPHAAVACTQCHVGPGAGAFIRGKLAGTRQLLDVMTNRVPKPVPPPSDLIQPVTMTCEQCHSRATTYGDELRVLHEYANDEANTESTTSLRLHVGDRLTGIHRHVGMDIEYVALDQTRASIPIVRVRDASGAVRQYVGEGADRAQTGVTRQMTCTDCHNRPAHTFSFSPERAVDAALARDAIPRDLPFVRREAVAAVTETHESRQAALEAIARRLTTFYQSRPGTNGASLARAIAGTQDAWGHNIFPQMKVTWGTYPNHLGHIDTPGCFRCHDDGHKAADGAVIKQDCELCHTLPE
jgi:hypothetical protein